MLYSYLPCIWVFILLVYIIKTWFISYELYKYNIGEYNTIISWQIYALRLFISLFSFVSCKRLYWSLFWIHDVIGIKAKFVFPPIIGESYEISSFVISPWLGRSPFPGYPFQWSSLWFISSFLSLKSNIIFKYQKFIFKGKQDSDKLCKTLDLNFLIMIMTVPWDLATRTLSFVFVFVFVCVFVIVNMCQWVENIITFP